MGKHLNRASRSMQLRFFSVIVSVIFPLISRCDFWSCFGSFLEAFGYSFSMIFGTFFPIKNMINFSIDFHRFWDGFWGPESLKMSTSCRREAHFHKIAFSDSGTILEAKMMKKGS